MGQVQRTRTVGGYSYDNRASANSKCLRSAARCVTGRRVMRDITIMPSPTLRCLPLLRTTGVRGECEGGAVGYNERAHAIRVKGIGVDMRGGEIEMV